MKQLESTFKEHKQNQGIVQCPSCEGMIVEKKTKKGSSFYGCSNYKEGCKVTYPSKLAGKSLTYEWRQTK
ncbi:topoisomerase DNA-binding C4 zinc finger domain-containing protein [Neobacillus drentensis]|uniref:topoisomerase DNA-binding C4 zinc finger domain-containing protein n=1 Tax=Neobacillus drentensis TaxID=220684 RepID=UPI002FFEBF79